MFQIFRCRDHTSNCIKSKLFYSPLDGNNSCKNKSLQLFLSSLQFYIHNKYKRELIRKYIGD